MGSPASPGQPHLGQVKKMSLHMCCALLAASRGAAHMGQPRMG